MGFVRFLLELVQKALLLAGYLLLLCLALLKLYEALPVLRNVRRIYLRLLIQDYEPRAHPAENQLQIYLLLDQLADPLVELLLDLHDLPSNRPANVNQVVCVLYLLFRLLRSYLLSGIQLDKPRRVVLTCLWNRTLLRELRNSGKYLWISRNSVFRIIQFFVLLRIVFVSETLVIVVN